jgi:dihydrofolate reductase
MRDGGRGELELECLVPAPCIPHPESFTQSTAGEFMRISIIAAVAENGVIGRGGKLPWHLSRDLRRFKELTMGHTIVMGRRTWESIGRPLPGRRTIVVTRQPNYQVDAATVQTAASLDDALHVEGATGDNEVFIIGGAELYREAMPRADRLYLTMVMAEVDGDTYFPPALEEFNWNDWVCLQHEFHEADAQNDYPHTFLTLERCESSARNSP